MRRSTALLFAFLLALASLGGGCAVGDDDASEGATGDERGDSGDSGESDGDGGAGTGSGGGGDGAGEPLQADRSLIRTAEISMTVDDVEVAASAAVAAAREAGGFQSGGSLDLTEPRTGVVELRVPADAFETVVAAVGELGEVADQALSVEDVTETVVDLDSRIRAAEASVERVRSFLSNTANVTELASVESELTARETQLDTLRAQQRALSQRVDLATITLRFGEEEAPALVTDPKASEDIPSFLRALRYGWVAVVTVAQVAAAVVGFALPLLLVAAPVWLGRRIWRRRTPAATG